MAMAVRALKERLGDDAMGGLQSFVDDAGRKWKDDMLSLAAERFDRRLGDELGALRLDMGEEFATLRVEAARDMAAVRVEMAGMRTELRTELLSMAAGLRTEMAATRFNILKWSFVFWIGQFAAMSAMTAFLLRTIGGR